MTMGTAVRLGRTGRARRAALGGSLADDTITGMAELLSDARPSMVCSGVAVAAVAVGVAVEEAMAPMSLHAGVLTLLGLGLAAVVVFSLFRSAFLLLSAGRPLADEMTEMRRQSGAMVDPRAPWTTMVRPARMSEAWKSERVQAMLGAAYFRTVRAHLALSWAALAVICFFAWTFVALIAAGRL